MRWTEQPIYFVDFEGSRTSGILEFGVATVLGGQVIEPRTRLCAATGRVRADDILVHGLREADVAGAQPFADEWDVFADLRERGPLAAHYAGVENALIKSVWPYPRNSPDFARPGERLIDWGPWVDTGAIYAQLYPQLPSGRLESLVAACGLQPGLDALAARHCDALAGALLLASLAREPALAQLSTMQLLALSTLDAGRRDALQQRTLF
jgi:DNA polymerase-3 subunit epsilon